MANVLKPKTLEWLKKQRWTEEREWKDEPALIAGLREFGHEPHPPALQFLLRYGGYTFIRPAPFQRSALVMFHTDALEAADRLEPKWCEDGAAIAGSRLCPIGECGYEAYLVAMDEKGYVWAMMAQALEWLQFGDSGEDYLNQLCS